MRSPRRRRALESAASLSRARQAVLPQASPGHHFDVIEVFVVRQQTFGGLGRLLRLPPIGLPPILTLPSSRRIPQRVRQYAADSCVHWPDQPGHRRRDPRESEQTSLDNDPE